MDVYPLEGEDRRPNRVMKHYSYYYYYYYYYYFSSVPIEKLPSGKEKKETKK